MTKEQINYLLVLATLLIVWLFFNTFYTCGKRNCSMGSGFGGMPMAPRGMMGQHRGSMATMNIPEPPNMAELLKSRTLRMGQAPAASEGKPAASSKASQTEKPVNS